MPKALWSKCLPIALWPPADRVAWEAAMRPRDPFESDGIATHWSVATRRKTAKGYGRFLCWLKERGELDEAADPIARVTRERLNACLDDLRRTNRGHTIQNRIQELGDAMRVLAPNRDWSFIRRAAARLRATTVPARDKRGGLPPTVEIIARGYRMMELAEEPDALSELARAALYRDGLLLVFLAYHPLRIRNLSSLHIGRELIIEDDRIALKIDAPETKSRQRIEHELSPRLSRREAIHRPISSRPIAGERTLARTGWGRALGVARRLALQRQTFRNIVAKHATGPNGTPLSPHLFRSMAATSVAIEAPGSVDLIRAILTHRLNQTGEQYYNLAGSLDASRFQWNARRDPTDLRRSGPRICEAKGKAAMSKPQRPTSATNAAPRAVIYARYSSENQREPRSRIKSVLAKPGSKPRAGTLLRLTPITRKGRQPFAPRLSKALQTGEAALTTCSSPRRSTDCRGIRSTSQPCSSISALPA